MNHKKALLECTDYLVSGEEFQIVTSPIQGILQTTPIPKVERIGRYYQSENYISHTDSNKGLIPTLYQWVKKYALQQKVNLITTYHNEAKSLLDIGSGTGDFIKAVSEKGISSIGTEPSEQARKRSLEKGNKVVENLDALKATRFDVVSLWHVLEHVYNPSEQLEQIHQLLNEEGLLLIAVPNYKSYDARYYKSHWAAYDVPRHLWHFSQQGMQTLLADKGFDLIKTKGMYFDSFYVSLLSEKNKTGKSNLLKAFTLGLISNLKALNSKDYSSLLYIAQKKS